MVSARKFFLYSIVLQNSTVISIPPNRTFLTIRKEPYNFSYPVLHFQSMSLKPIYDVPINQSIKKPYGLIIFI